MANLQVDARSSNTAVLPDDNIELKAGSQSDERVLELTLNRQATGTAEVTITVTDQQGLSTSQTFTLTVEDDDDKGTGDYRPLHSMLNDQCLTVTGDSSEEGAGVQLAECQGNETQQWFHDADNRLRAKVASNMCLDLGTTLYWGSYATIRQCVGTDDPSSDYSHQQWHMEANMLVNQKNSDLVLTAHDSGTVFAWSQSGYWGGLYSKTQKSWKWGETEKHHPARSATI